MTSTPPETDTPSVAALAKPYQAPALTDLGPIHVVTATYCDPPGGPSDSGMIINPGPGGGSICDWC